jgi:hypothetical protein
MNFKNYSQDMVAELLVYLADHENFDSIKTLKNISKQDVVALFQDMAGQLKEHSLKQPLMRKSHVKQEDLTDKTSKVIAKLTPQEEEILFKSFKIS